VSSTNPSGALGTGQHGRCVQRLEMGDFVLSRSVYPPGMQINNHVHRDPFFSLVLRGGFTEIGRREHVECTRSLLLFRAPDEEHANRFHDTGAEFFRVELGAAWADKVRHNFPKLQSSSFSKGGDAAWLALRLANEACHIDDCSPLVVQGLVLETLGAVARLTRSERSGRVPAWLKAAREMLHDSFSEPFDAATVAQSVGVHPVHLSRAFRRYFGSTMGEYLRRVRIDYACEQLASSDHSMAQVAIDAGFSGQSHFSVAFKHVTGLTPGQYRTSFRDKRVKGG